MWVNLSVVHHCLMVSSTVVASCIWVLNSKTCSPSLTATHNMNSRRRIDVLINARLKKIIARLTRLKKINRSTALYDIQVPQYHLHRQQTGQYFTTHLCTVLSGWLPTFRLQSTASSHSFLSLPGKIRLKVQKNSGDLQLHETEFQVEGAPRHSSRGLVHHIFINIGWVHVSIRKEINTIVNTFS